MTLDIDSGLSHIVCLWLYRVRVLKERRNTIPSTTAPRLTDRHKQQPIWMIVTGSMLTYTR